MKMVEGLIFFIPVHFLKSFLKIFRKMDNLEIPEFNPLIPPPVLELNKSLEMKDSPKIIKELSNKSNEKKLFSKSSKEKSQTLTHL